MKDVYSIDEINKFYNIINSLREDYHMPIILVSHDLSHVYKYATSYALIDHKVIEVGQTKDLLKSENVKNTFGINLGSEEEILWK